MMQGNAALPGQVIDAAAFWVAGAARSHRKVGWG